MKALNEKSSKVLRKLIDCMNDPNFAKTLGSYAKIGKPDSCYMPVSVEKLAHIPTFDEHIVAISIKIKLRQSLSLSQTGKTTPGRRVLLCSIGCSGCMEVISNLP